MNVTIEIENDLMPSSFRVAALMESGIMIGYVNISLEGEFADLCDIYVKSDQKIGWPTFYPILQREYNFRNRGIGSKLLKTAIDRCVELGETKLIGWMHGDRIRLIEFYSLFGFQVKGIYISLNLTKNA